MTAGLRIGYTFDTDFGPYDVCLMSFIIRSFISGGSVGGCTLEHIAEAKQICNTYHAKKSHSEGSYKYHQFYVRNKAYIWFFQV